MTEIWVPSYVIVRCSVFKLKHEECFVHIGVGFRKIGLHNNPLTIVN
jgi:hypothetical protein